MAVKNHGKNHGKEELGNMASIGLQVGFHSSGGIGWQHAGGTGASFRVRAGKK